MPYSVIVPGLDMLHDLVDHVPDVFAIIYKKLLPGKFTFLFKVSKSIDPALVKGSEHIGIRIPNPSRILNRNRIPNRNRDPNRNRIPNLKSTAQTAKQCRIVGNLCPYVVQMSM